MYRNKNIFYSAMLLTLVNLALRFAGTSFQVFLSNNLGAAGVGLLQLVMSTGSLCMIAGMAGIRTTAMYLTADRLGKSTASGSISVLSVCFRYSMICSGTAALILYVAAPWIAENWIGAPLTCPSLRLYSAFLPVVCLCGVMTGYYTGTNRIGTLAAVEILEQTISIGITTLLLTEFSSNDPARACSFIVLGSSLGACITLIALAFLLPRRKQEYSDSTAELWSQLFSIAIPLALADMLKAGISTSENLMVPKRLALHSNTNSPLAHFGIVTGMIFPVIMFPACILFGLAELLIPELARCNACHSTNRIQYLVKRSLKAAALYGIITAGIVSLTGQALCKKLYGNLDAASGLAMYSLLIPMLYCDILTDAMTKGLGQQTACVRYNIFTSAMDVCLLFFLLPKMGMQGYFISFFLTHLINFILSLRRLLIITKIRLPIFRCIVGLLTFLPARIVSGYAGGVAEKVLSFLLIQTAVWYLMGTVRKEDLSWILHLFIPEKKSRCHV